MQDSHEVRIENNDLHGEDRAYITVCSCGWGADWTRSYMIALAEASQHVNGPQVITAQEPCIFCDNRPHDKRASHFARKEG